MPAQRQKLYPIRGRYLQGVPTAVQYVDTKKDADALVETGAFTLNPNDPDRDSEAADFTKDEPELPVDVDVDAAIEAANPGTED